MYTEKDLTWSSIEKKYDYSKVQWRTEKNGIPSFVLYGEEGNRININLDIFI
jgi:hypothetical protein